MWDIKFIILTWNTKITIWKQLNYRIKKRTQRVRIHSHWQCLRQWSGRLCCDLWPQQVGTLSWCHPQSLWFHILGSRSTCRVHRTRCKPPVWQRLTCLSHPDQPTDNSCTVYKQTFRYFGIIFKKCPRKNVSTINNSLRAIYWDSSNDCLACKRVYLAKSFKTISQLLTLYLPTPNLPSQIVVLPDSPCVSEHRNKIVIWPHSPCVSEHRNKIVI